MDINLDAPRMTLQETVVARINGYRVGCGNVLVRPIPQIDGADKEGMSMRLSIAHSGQQLIIGMNSIFEIEGNKWRVLEINPKSEELKRGQVVIEQIVEMQALDDLGDLDTLEDL